MSDLRASVMTAMIVVLAIVAGLALIREGTETRDHDSIVRSARGASQRLEAAEGLGHEWDVPETLLSVAATTSIGRSASLSAASRTTHGPPGLPAAEIADLPVVAESLLLVARDTPAPRPRPRLLVQGRAPPA